MTEKETIIEKEFFRKLADKLEELFEKGELCQCGKKLPCRSKVLSFNAYANIFLKEALTKQKDDTVRMIDVILEEYHQEDGDISLEEKLELFKNELK